MKKNANIDLRNMATSAKRRLKQGFYMEKQKELQYAIDNCNKRGINVDDVAINKKIETKREIEISRCKALEADEVFYKKVCQILQNDSDIIDPIGKLVDKEVFDKLTTSIARQKYILELSTKFREMSERYQKERLYIN